MSLRLFRRDLSIILGVCGAAIIYHRDAQRFGENGFYIRNSELIHVAG